MENKILSFDHLKRKKNEHSNEIYVTLIDCVYSKSNLIRIFGVTEFGNSIQINVMNYEPYLYIQPPLQLVLEESQIEIFRLKINYQLNIKGYLKDINIITKIELSNQENIRTFKGIHYNKQNYLKLYFSSLANLQIFQQRVNKGFHCEGYEILTQTFEGKISYPLKFMVDKDLRGMGWFKIKNFIEEIEIKSNCILNYNVKFEDIVQEQNKETIVNLRIISIDIETNALGKQICDDDEEIILISIILTNSQEEFIQKFIFTQKFCEQINNTQLVICQNEIEMLQNFYLLFISWDADIITGYNIINNTIPLIVNRMQLLNLDTQYLNFSRSNDEQCIIKKGKFYNSSLKLRETNSVSINGRIQIDTLILSLKCKKLINYTLGSIYFSIFKKQIPFYDQEIINQLINNSQIKRIATYSLRKTEAYIEIMKNQGWIITYIEIAKTTGVTINYLIMRGQSIKVLSQLLRQSKQFQYIIPDEYNIRKMDTSTLKGALVLQPQKGFYKTPLALFDFVSLYPSIIIAYNMCYTTLILDNSIQMNEEDIFIIPETGVKFVKSHIKKGLLPLILENLLKIRAETKIKLKDEQNQMNKEQLDAKQQALKIAANSLFGFTGCAEHGYLPCLEITQSILQTGRIILQKAISFISKTYPNSKIMYGDTDSLLIDFQVQSIKECFDIGNQVANDVTSNYPQPIKLSLDKVYNPFLLLFKKKYAGLQWKNYNEIERIDSKGISSIRRDNCELIRILVNDILNLIFIEKNIKAAVNLVQKTIQGLRNKEFNISQFIISKGLSIKIQEDEQNVENDEQKYHSYPDKYHDLEIKRISPHIKVAKEKVNNNEANEYQKGDRIQYVIVENQINLQLSNNAQDPLFAFQNNMSLDIDYYINQIKGPIINIFEHLIPNPESLFIQSKCNPLQSKKFIQKQQQFQTSTKALDKYFKKKHNCLNCKEEIPKHLIICYQCKSQKAQILAQLSYKLINEEKLYHKYNRICLECQQNHFQQIICKNIQCNVFFQRLQSINNIEQQQYLYSNLFYDQF